MQWVTQSKCGSKAASQLSDRTARIFSSNSLVENMEISADIQYTLTAAQSFGSQDCYNKSLLMILRFANNEQT